MSLTLEYVNQLYKVIPDKTHIYAVRYDNHICACAFIYTITPTVWYVQYWGDDPTAEVPRSPMNLLVAGIVNEALRLNVRVIDVGASNEGLSANQGLIQFKKSVGAEPELRWVLTKAL